MGQRSLFYKKAGQDALFTEGHGHLVSELDLRLIHFPDITEIDAQLASKEVGVWSMCLHPIAFLNTAVEMYNPCVFLKKQGLGPNSSLKMQVLGLM